MVAFLADMLGAQACLKLWSAKPNPPGTGGWERRINKVKSLTSSNPPAKLAVLPTWLPVYQKVAYQKVSSKRSEIATGTRDIFRWLEIVDHIKNVHRIEYSVVGLLLKVNQSNPKQQNPTDHSKWLIAPNFIPLRKITVRLSLTIHCVPLPLP